MSHDESTQRPDEPQTDDERRRCGCRTCLSELDARGAGTAVAAAPSPGHLTAGRLTVFLYVLLRDAVPAGVVEGILVDHVEKTDWAEPGAVAELSAAHLGQYAEALAGRLSPFRPDAALHGGPALRELRALGADRSPGRDRRVPTEPDRSVAEAAAGHANGAGQ